MKKAAIIFAILITNNIFCNEIDTLNLESKITDVTIFLNGAQITRQIDMKANKGKYLLIIDNLPQELNPQSIQINAVEKSKILSVKHHLVFPVLNKKEKNELEIEDNIDLQKFKISDIKNQYKVFELEEDVIFKNSSLKNPEVKDIKEAAEFYRAKLNEIKHEKLKLLKELEDANKKLQEYFVQLNEITTKSRKTYSQILVILDCEQEIKGDLKIDYYVPSAGWTPIYDFRVDDITNPLNIVYNANVFQSTGENWDNVKMTLSTNNPSLSGTKPEILKWDLNRRSPYQANNAQQGYGTLTGRVLDENINEEISGASIILKQEDRIITGGITSMDGSYSIKPISLGYYDVEISCLGYKTVFMQNIYIPAGKTTIQNFKMQSDMNLLSEIQIVNYQSPLIMADQTSTGATMGAKEIAKMPARSGTVVAANMGGVYSEDGSVRGSREDGTVYYVDGVKVRGSTAIPKSATTSPYYYSYEQPKTTLQERTEQRNDESYSVKTDPVVKTNYISNSIKTNISNLEYAIDIPYTIPSDGKDYFIKIKDVSLPVTYIYNAVPKLDNDIFLTALITDWTELNLLSGKTNIYYQGTYTGESFIDTESAEDTLKVSLGRDRNIIVQREANKKIFDKKILSSNIKETVGWDITIRNNKNSKIKIIIEDQFPISERKSIEVERLEYLNAKLDDKTGKLTWELELNPSEKTVVSYKYSVKYPNYLNLNLD